MSDAKLSPLPRTEMDALLLGRLDELTESHEANARARNVLGIVISIMVLTVISTLIVASIIVVSPDIVTGGSLLSAVPPREPISLQDTVSGALSPNTFGYSWLAPYSAANTNNNNNNQQQLHTSIEYDSTQNAHDDDELVFDDARNVNYLRLKAPSPATEQDFEKQAQNRQNSPPNLLQFSPHLQVQTLVPNSSVLSILDYQGFEVLPSRKYLLVSTQRKRLFRHSQTARYFAYDIQRDLLAPLSLLPTEYVGGSNSGSGAAQDYNSGDEHASQGGDRFQFAHPFTAPNGADALILVHQNDLYVLPDISTVFSSPSSQPQSTIQRTSSQTTKRLTKTGAEFLSNGLTNWLYEEEVFGDSRAFGLAPGGAQLAYLSFNDSLVSQMPIPLYGADSSPVPQVPQVLRLRYPKTGRVNTRVAAHIVELASGVLRNVELPEELAVEQHYITSLDWISSSKLALSWMSRNQSELRVLVCGAVDSIVSNQNWRCSTSVAFSEPNGWLEMLAGGKVRAFNATHYLLVARHFEGADVGFFPHLALVNFADVDSNNNNNNQISYLTSGRFEVTEVNGVDARNGIVYFTSTLVGQPGVRHLHSVLVYGDGGANSGRIKCLTCAIYPAECKYNSASLAPSLHHFVFECLGPGVPRYELRQLPTVADYDAAAVNDYFDTANQNQTHLQKPVPQPIPRLVWAIEDNVRLRAELATRRLMPVPLRLEVPIASGDFKAHVHVLLPPPPPATAGAASAWRHWPNRKRPARSSTSFVQQDYQQQLQQQQFYEHLTNESLSRYIEALPAGIAKFPMVVDVYAGPESQHIDFRYHIDFGHYLSSSKRIVYAMIDGRGSGHEGSRRAFQLRHKLGSAEIADQIEVSRLLANDKLAAFVDKSRVAIWGWSYGGYAAAMALARSNTPQPFSPDKLEQHLQPLQQPPQPPLPLPLLQMTPVSALLSAAASAALGKAPPSPLELAAVELQAASAATTDSVFECAASVAPVTNWLLYDTVYTERYMSSPFVNEKYDYEHFDDHLESQSPANTNKSIGVNDINDRYKKASLIDQIATINRKRFLLIHGTADDNVHFQQSLALMKRLTNLNILFETQLYTDENHSLGGKKHKLHLGLTLTNFLSECFDIAY